MQKENIYLTSEGLEKLKKEYQHLVTVRRKEVTERIAKAREYGDISENSEYDTAKDEQSFVEGRILELEEIIKHAKTIDKAKKADIVRLGSKVKVDVNGQQDEFIIVSSIEADPMEGKISDESPVGKSLIGAKVGDVVTVASTIKATYRILEIN
ncbi:MAG: transcription elongation factor GreA [Candidatus Woykebacteria bacterium RIFCSPHIGHO2_01_FULL_39_12]|uniref:Transcription elongation factor GreA n=1 Tax=Candidatus Woykebacteria bacterium RIFCSPHIGHO2_01_FULL_39_12 TaxID=1802599 RepID=A0A1G1WGQ1_9BACT|nr:MAG: transcription elongation factor GreA [Candidatus Woykebacteria bacterium RIFCSPHIGHO2_01_FULL_39_12]